MTLVDLPKALKLSQDFKNSVSEACVFSPPEFSSKARMVGSRPGSQGHRILEVSSSSLGWKAPIRGERIRRNPGWKCCLRYSPAPSVQVRCLRPRGGKEFSQGHIAAKRQNENGGLRACWNGFTETPPCATLKGKELATPTDTLFILISCQPRVGGPR